MCNISGKHRLYGLFVFLFMIFTWLFIKAGHDFASHTEHYFQASIGLLTVLAIFYAFTTGETEESISQITLLLQSEQRQISQNRLNSKLRTLIGGLAKEKKITFEAAKKIRLNGIDLFLEVVNYHKWLAICAIAHLICISMFLTGNQNWILYVQVIAFWVAYYCSVVIIISWYVYNRVRKSLKEVYGLK